MTRRELFQKVVGALVAGPLSKLVPEKYILGLKRSAPMTFPVVWRDNLLIIDDPYLANEIWDEATRQRVRQWYENVVYPPLLRQPTSIKELTSMANTPEQNGRDGDYKWYEMSGATVIVKEGQKGKAQDTRNAVIYGPREERLTAAMMLISWYKASDEKKAAAAKPTTLEPDPPVKIILDDPSGGLAEQIPIKRRWGRPSTDDPGE